MVCGDDDGFIPDVVAKVIFDPLGIETNGWVRCSPEGHIVVLFRPKEETETEGDAENESKADGGPRMSPD